MLSAAHYQAIRVALAHNTFQEAEASHGPPRCWPLDRPVGMRRLRPLVADTTPWLSRKR